MWILLLVLGASGLQVLSRKEPITRLAFGSCANQFRKKNPEIFHSIANWNPDLFVWLGDAIYADILTPFVGFKSRAVPEWKALYDSFKQEEGYKQLREKINITGVWDDHDYGLNNAGKEFLLKRESKELYLDFLEEDRSVRGSHEGVYVSYTFGEKGKQVKLILVDIRYFRDSESDKEGDSLGEEQWQWLENELKNPGDLTIIGNGIQINIEDRLSAVETWHKKSRERLFQLIKEIPGVILLSGDVHMGEIMRNPCLKYPLYEITSSGMTHTAFNVFGYLIYLGLYGTFPWTYDLTYRTVEKNFGTVEINWEDKWVELSVRDSYSQTLLSHKVAFEELSSECESTYLCYQKPLERKLKHIAAFAGVFYLPLALHLFALLIFLRKYTNSY